MTEPERATTPRVAPLPPKEWPPEMREALAVLRPPDAVHEVTAPKPGRSKGLMAT